LQLSAVAVIGGVESAAVRDGNNTKGLLVVNTIAASTIPGMILIIHSRDISYILLYVVTVLKKPPKASLEHPLH